MTENAILYAMDMLTTDKKLRAKQPRQQMTLAEEYLWQLLRRSQLGGSHFSHQQIIDGVIVDFYCYKEGQVVELDGAIHLQQKEADAERENALAKRGLTMARFKNEDVLGNAEQKLHKTLEICQKIT